MDMLDVEREEKGVEGVMRDLGFCIVKNVLTSDECVAMEKLMNEDLMELVDEEEVAKSTKSVQEAWEKAKQQGVGEWPAGSLEVLGDKNRFQLRGLPHGRFAWACRLHPNVRKVYEILHHSKHLVSSFDNTFVANRSSANRKSNPLWPHVDQNDCDTSRHFKSWNVYQGLLYIWPSEELRSSTTVVWPKSHLPEIYDHYMNDPKTQARGERGSHFTLIQGMSNGPVKDAMMKGWLENSRRVPVPAGGLLLWQSRTTHQGWSGGPRLAQPVCWEPIERRTEETRKRKIVLTCIGFPSTHSASLGAPHHLVKKKRPQKQQSEGGEPGGERERVVFPLRETVNSVAVGEGETSLHLWDRLSVKSFKDPIPPAVAALATHSLKQEFLDVL